MTFLRFLMLLPLTIWLGALIFFSAVPQTSFSVLRSTHLAGLVVRSTLLTLHWMAFSSGMAFLGSSLIYNRAIHGSPRALGLSHVLVFVMLALAAVSQCHIIARKDTLRAEAGEVASLAANNPIRQQFDPLHTWSTRLEGTILSLGLILLYSTARRFHSSHS